MGIVNNALSGASGQSSGYNLTKSLRFRRSASATLSRTPSTSGNRKTWTMSFWYKRGIFGITNNMLGCYAGVNDDANNFEFRFNTSDQLQVVLWNYLSTTSSVFRDPSAWYHIVLALDTTQAGTSSGSKIKVYVNGVLQSWGSDSISSSISQNDDLIWNSATTQFIGRWQASDGGAYFQDCYMAEVNFINGQALTPSSFGETSTSTGVWIPKKYTGTYGTNGFYLPFTNTASTSTLGNDFSGNSNTWTVNNISLTSGSTYDSMNDVPTLTSATTANYCVMNPLIQTSNLNLSNGNLTITGTGSYSTSPATFGMSSGKWYWEYTCTTYSASGDTHYGIGTSAFNIYQNTWIGSTSAGWIYAASNGNKYNNNSAVAYGATFTSGDIIGVAFDADVGTLTFYKNGTTQGTAYTGLTSGAYFPVATVGTSNLTNANFGQQPFAYTPPTGFKALNTFNLPTPTIGATASTQANDYFDVSLYTGNSGTQSITNSGSMQPDFVWLKSRSNALDHGLFDSVRGVQNVLASNGTGAANYGGTGELTAFNSNGFTLVNSGSYQTNQSGYTYVGWQWRASNATAVTNTAGSITSTVSANTTAGFSIVTWTGPNNNTTSTVGHGLGVTPSMVIYKSRNSAVNWNVWCSSFTGGEVIYLNLTNAKNSDTNVFNNTAPSSTLLTVKNIEVNSSSMVAYCFAPIAGYSAFGSYTGNGSSDGPFIFTGFRPKFLILKRTDAGADAWIMADTSIQPYNVVGNFLQPSQADAELYAVMYDLLSNGFKLRQTYTTINTSGGTYIYMAFAENPFKYANAR